MKFDGPLLNDRWRLGPRMGSGAQARTYLARDEKSRTERVVVLKQFELRNKDSNWKNFDLFEREVRVLKSLRHPGIPRFIESFESEPGVFNLVMEKMSGATLRSIATKVRFTSTELRDILIGKGWAPGDDLEYVVGSGHLPNETAWAERAPGMFTFLLDDPDRADQ